MENFRNWLKSSVEVSGISMKELESQKKIDFSGDMHEGSKAWKTVWRMKKGRQETNYYISLMW